MKNWLDYRFENNPNDIFLRNKDRVFSYEEVGNNVYDRALALQDFGVQKSHKVGIFLSDSLDFIESYLSCYKINAISVILNTKWKESELTNALDLVSLDFIICSFSDKKLFLNCGKPIIFIEELSKSFGSCAPKSIIPKMKAEDIQSILFTSGTEGNPKAVCLTYDNFYQSSLKWEKAVFLNNSDSYMLCLPLYHIGGLAILMRALHIGFSVNLNFDLKNNFTYFKNISIISVVPTLLMNCIKNDEYLEYLKSIRVIIVSGSGMSRKLFEKCKKESLNIFFSYGMTETCSSICGYWLLEKNNHYQSVGYPFEGVSIKIENQNIIIESNTIMKSYFNGSDTKGIFKTSDCGAMNNDLLVYGRIDETIISGGKNIDPLESIKAIKTFLPNCEISQFKKNDPYWGEINSLHIYTNSKITADEIKQKLKKMISDYKIPKEIIIKQPI